jgi:hypothetical protein
MRSAVWLDKDVGFHIVATGSSLAVMRTSNGGASWIQIATFSAVAPVAFDVWYDQWTPGDTGTLIHVVWFDVTNDDVLYRTYDASALVMGTQRTVFAGATAAAGVNACISVTKARGGNLYCVFDIDAGVERGFYRSVDAGVNWSAQTQILGGANQYALLFPGGEADTQDILAVLVNGTTNTLTVVRWDDSVGSTQASTPLITLVDNTTDLTAQWMFSGSVRHSDNHVIVAICSDRDTASADHRIWDITNEVTWTELAAITSNIDDHYHPQVYIDQGTDDIYVAYVGKRDGSETLGTAAKVYYAKSTDDGATWSAGDTAYMEGAAGAVFQTYAAISGDRFYVSWRVGTTLSGNAVNSLDLTPAGGGAFTLTADPGSVSIAGTAASLLRRLKLAADPGSVVITGTPATMSKGFRMTADAGSVAITGTAATLRLTRRISADAGTVSITGTAASLEKGFKLSADPGSVTISGTAATPRKGFGLIATAGAIAITGTAASLEKGYRLDAAAGAVLISGTDATLTKGGGNRALSADPGALVITGIDASLERGLRLTAEAGSVVIAGTAASLNKGRNLTAEPGSVQITGTPASLERGLRLTADPGAFVISGTAATLTKTPVPSSSVAVVDGSGLRLARRPARRIDDYRTREDLERERRMVEDYLEQLERAKTPPPATPKQRAQVHARPAVAPRAIPVPRLTKAIARAATIAELNRIEELGRQRERARVEQERQRRRRAAAALVLLMSH